MQSSNRLAAILSELAAVRQRENELLTCLTTLLATPPPEARNGIRAPAGNT